MFEIGDKVVVDRVAIIHHILEYDNIRGPLHYVLDPVYDGLIGEVFHRVTIPFKGVMVDWGDQGMLPHHEWELKKVEI